MKDCWVNCFPRVPRRPCLLVCAGVCASFSPSDFSLGVCVCVSLLCIFPTVKAEFQDRRHSTKTRILLCAWRVYIKYCALSIGRVRIRTITRSNHPVLRQRVLIITIDNCRYVAHTFRSVEMKPRVVSKSTLHPRFLTTDDPSSFFFYLFLPSDRLKNGSLLLRSKKSV